MNVWKRNPNYAEIVGVRQTSARGSTHSRIQRITDSIINNSHTAHTLTQIFAHISRKKTSAFEYTAAIRIVVFPIPFLLRLPSTIHRQTSIVLCHALQFNEHLFCRMHVPNVYLLCIACLNPNSTKKKKYTNHTDRQKITNTKRSMRLIV